MAIIPLVLSQHVEEAALLWMLRERAVDQPHFSLDELLRLDTRLDAHLDGLKAADKVDATKAWNACTGELKWGDAEEYFAASLLAFVSNDASRVQQIYEAASPENSRAIVSALGWLPYPQVSEAIQSLLRSNVPHLREVGMEASVIHRRLTTAAIRSALNASDLGVATAALRGMGMLGYIELVDVAREFFSDEKDSVRLAAARSVAMMTADEQASQILREAAEAGSKAAKHSMQILSRRMTHREYADWCRRLIGQPKTIRIGIEGLGFAGCEHVPLLFDLMADSTLARLSGAAFVTMTGFDLTQPEFQVVVPKQSEDTLEDDSSSSIPPTDDDEHLPWPDKDRLECWWKENHEVFSKDNRYLCGRIASLDWLREVLRHGLQRQRAEAAIERVLISPVQPMFNVRAPAWTQISMLEAGDGTGPFDSRAGGD